MLVLLLLLASGVHAATTCRVFAMFDRVGMVFGPIQARYQVRGNTIVLELGPESSPEVPSSPVRVVTDVPERIRKRAPEGTFLVGRSDNAWYFFTR